MRHPVAILVALALWACRVDTEGAQCRVPGAIEDCPAGQACGNDGRCSARALACATTGSRCEVGTALCAGADGKQRVERCSGDVDRACGSWVVEDCAAAGLECGTRGPAAACQCMAFSGGTAPELAADPVAGSPDPGAAPFPTGAPEPAVCRFKRLGDALEAAARAGGSASVRAFGSPGAAVLFGDVASGESFPLDVAADVTLLGAAPPAGPTIVRVEGAATIPALVELQGALDGIRIESAQAIGIGVRTTCPPDEGGRPRLAAVTVDGGGLLTKGVDVEGGACGAELSGVEVSGVDGPALEVGAYDGVPVTVLGGRFSESDIGIRAKGGKLTVGSDDPAAAVEVSGNEGEGIVLTGGPTNPFRTLDIELLGTTVRDNGGTGVVLDVVSSASKLVVRGCTVYANGGTSPRRYGPGDTQRTAGGVFVHQASLSLFTFAGNRLSWNGGDQLAFEAGSWSISPGSPGGCGPSSNLFACPRDGYAVANTGGGTVNASHSVWPDSIWNNYVSVGVTVAAYCNGEQGAPALPAVCPAP